MEITTGMSAPPMGMMISTPMTTARMASAQKAVWESVEVCEKTRAKIYSASNAFNGCCPGNTTGAPDTSPCSLVKATTEPVKVMAPMATPRTSRRGSIL